MKVDSDVIRLSPSMRNQIEAYASLKGEQVIPFYIYLLYIFSTMLISDFIWISSMLTMSDLCR